MHQDQKLFLVPPKLQKGFLLAGLRIGEWLIILAMVIFCFLSRQFQFVAFPIAVYLLCCRPVDNRNALDYFRVRFRYCLTAQHFIRKEYSHVKKTAYRKPD